MSETTTDPIIVVEDLHKSFGSNEVLKGISTTVNRGEVVAVIGPSGSGKSTFLRCLNLLEDVTSGSVKVEGIDLTDRGTDINQVRQKIGMVFQSYELFPHKTILENILLAPMKVQKRPRSDVEKEALELLELLELLVLPDVPPLTVSSSLLLVTVQSL